MFTFNEVTKGDSINLECTLKEDITNWKIRVELFDNSGKCIKLASVNAGGTAGDIEITDLINGIFIIHVQKDLTTCFADTGFIEIEVETNASPTEKFTILKGKDSKINFIPEKIKWDTP